MIHPFQSIDQLNIQELRTILHQISQENSSHIMDSLQQHLEDQHHAIKNISGICIEEIQKKEQSVSNLVKFSLHLIDQLQTKIDQHTKIKDQIRNLNIDFAKVMLYNEELLKRVHQVDQQNTYFKDKIQQTQTYVSEISQSDQLKTSLESLSTLQMRSIQIPSMNRIHSHFTERSPFQREDFIQKEEFNQKISQFQVVLKQKDSSIQNLEQQIKYMTERIMALQRQLSLKSSELELSEIYFREKIDIIASNQNLNRSQQVSISDLQMHSVFKKDLSRVSSSKSIDSIVQSESASSDNSQKQDHLEYNQKNNEQKYLRKSTIRRSLMQDYATDFVLEAKVFQNNNSQFHCEVFQDVSQFGYNECSSVNNSSISRQRKKSVSISTADIKRTATKAVQTGTQQYSRFSRKTVSKQKTVQKQHQSSFLGLDSITSIFSKKNKKQSNQYETTQELSHSKISQSQYASSFGDIFKGIFDYATQKIVTNRINKKHKNSSCLKLNQSFLQELKPAKKAVGSSKRMLF